MKTIHLEDNHQDFLEFDIDDKNIIVETRPFQGWCWNGGKVENTSIRKGTELRLKNKEGEVMVLKHKVKKVVSKKVTKTVQEIS